MFTIVSSISIQGRCTPCIWLIMTPVSIYTFPFFSCHLLGGKKNPKLIIYPVWILLIKPPWWFLICSSVPHTSGNKIWRLNLFFAAIVWLTESIIRQRGCVLLMRRPWGDPFISSCFPKMLQSLWSLLNTLFHSKLKSGVFCV